MRVIVIGAGGVGGWLTAGLAATLAHTKDIPADADRQLVIVDGDHFEPKNMARQHFQAMGNKASIRTQELTPLYPGVDIIDMPMWVVEEVPEGANDGDDSVEENTKAIAAKDLLAEEDIVFTVVDNFAARATVIAAAVPAIGSWNTRATRSARAHTGIRVTSTPSMAMRPLSTV